MTQYITFVKLHLKSVMSLFIMNTFYVLLMLCVCVCVCVCVS